MTLTMGATLCLFAGAIAATFGFLILVPAVRFAVAASASASGTVIGHDREENEEAVYYYPRVAFTAEGREWIVRDLIGHVRLRPPIGAKIAVHFPPGDPSAAELRRTAGVWFAAAAVIVGVALMTGGVLELVRG